MLFASEVPRLYGVETDAFDVSVCEVGLLRAIGDRQSLVGETALLGESPCGSRWIHVFLEIAVSNHKSIRINCH